MALANKNAGIGRSANRSTCWDMRMHVLALVICAQAVVTLDANTVKQKIEIREFCEGETFKASCEYNEVILIKHARYGRMRVSKCITSNYGQTGCFMDARAIIDAQCSGQRSCEFGVAALVPVNEQACPSDFRSYLEVSYLCVKVAFAPKEFCRSSGAIEVREQQGYLSSLITEETECGSMDAPWWVTAKPGQQLRMRLLDFRPQGMSPGRSHTCLVYATIKEEAVKASKTVCASTEREGIVYTSMSHTVEVRMRSGGQNPQKQDGFFLIQFEALGCPDPLAPSGGWMKRAGNDVFMGCNETAMHARTWKLTCEQKKWLGKSYNCSHGGATPMSARTSQSWGLFNTSHGLSILVIIGIAVAVGLCILLIGIIYIRRNRLRRGQRATTEPQNTYSAYEDTRQKPPTYTQQGIAKTGEGVDFYHSTENDYYRTWQLQKHPPAHAQSAGGITSMSLPPPPYSSGSGSAVAASGTGASGEHYAAYHGDRERPAMEHIYESPKFVRKEYRTEPERGEMATEYFELDPDSILDVGVVSAHPGNRHT